MLKKNNNKSIYNVLGIMSGTSMDGIDISLVETNGTNHLKIIKEKSYNYSIKIQKKFKNIIENKPRQKNKIKKYFYDNEDIFNFIIILYIKKFIKEFKIKNNYIDLISLSGQTVYHNPLEQISIQLGSGKEIANQFKIKTISNLRDNDIKHKGQGAPIGSYYHRYILKKLNNNSIIINLGGIANYSAIIKNNTYSSDIGPANCIIDDLTNYFFNKKFDKNGYLSSKGKPNKKILKSFEKDNFFVKKSPKSLDRNYFHKYHKRLLKIDKYDALSTATHMILIGFKKFIESLNFEFQNIILTGGGRNNKFLLKILRNNINKKIYLIDNFKINGDLVESQMFAYIGIRSIKKLIISNKFTTGVKKSISGGKLFIPN